MCTISSGGGTGGTCYLTVLTVSIISDFLDETLDGAAATAATPGIRGTRHFVLVVVQLPSHRPHREYDTQGEQQARRGGS